MARKPAITVSFASTYRNAPTTLAQWEALAPKYARFYESLQRLVRHGGGVFELAKLSGTSGPRVHAMLEGAELLGFVTQTAPKSWELLTMPSLETLRDEVVEGLKALGVPLFHGNGFWMDYTWNLYRHWCRAYKARHGRAYRPAVTGDGTLVNEVGALKTLVRALGHNEKIGAMMELFIDEHPVLELERHTAWRKYGLTLGTFCYLYAALAGRLERKGIYTRDEDELRQARTLIATFARKHKAETPA